jgi:tetratricopeptide (TPR) repeat protein
MNQKDQAEFEELKEMLKQFESANSNQETINFNEEEFENIIHFYLQNNQAQFALEASEMALTIFPYSSEFCLTKADAHLELGELDEAEEYLTNNFKIDKSDIDYYIILSEVYVLRNDYAKAIDICNEGIETCDDNLDTIYLHLAEIHDYQGEYNEMIPLLEASLELNPKNDDALYLYSITMSILDKVEEKINFYLKLIDEDPFNEDAWYYLGMSYREMGLYERAIESLEYIAAMDDEVNVLSDMSQIFFEAKEYTKAIDCLKDLEKRSELELVDYLTYGYSYKELGDLHRAKSYLKEALMFDEFNDEIYYELSLLFYEEHKYEAALPLINKALDKNNETPHYLELKADILIALKRDKEACNIYLSIIQLNNSTPYYLSKFAYITALQYGIDEAIKILDQGLIDYNHPALHFHKSIIYFLFEREEDGFHEFAVGLEHDFESHTIVLDKLPELKNNPKIQLMISLYENR